MPKLQAAPSRTRQAVTKMHAMRATLPPGFPQLFHDVVLSLVASADDYRQGVKESGESWHEARDRLQKEMGQHLDAFADLVLTATRGTF